jgi:hypothetical protein
VKKFAIYIVLFSTLYSQAQKKLEKTFVLDDHISTVVFDFEYVFSIQLRSTKNESISLKAISEGEYANHFVITEKNKGETVVISGRVTFTFPNNQDKLSAHKVHAIAIEIGVPEHLNTVINSDIGNLNAEGFFNSLTTNFMSGDCLLNDISGDLLIQTVEGSIHLSTKSGSVTAETKRGEIIKENLTKGNSVFKLKTIKGDINVKQSN